jgi:hypothetical protein
MGGYENTNGLLRQYSAKGIDISIYSQEQLNDVARLGPVADARSLLSAHYDSGLQRANGEGWQTGKILRV